MHKKSIFCIALTLLMILVSGCGQSEKSDNMKMNTVAVNKDGSISEYLVDSFDKNYYKISELREMANEEASEYNTAKQKGTQVPVTVCSVQASEEIADTVIVEYLYDCAATYRDFAEASFYYGTVAELSDQLKSALGSGKLTGVKKKDSLILEQVLSMDDKHVIISELPYMIKSPAKVGYLSEGLSLDENGNVDATAIDHTFAVILLNK